MMEIFALVHLPPAGYPMMVQRAQTTADKSNEREDYSRINRDV